MIFLQNPRNFIRKNIVIFLDFIQKITTRVFINGFEEFKNKNVGEWFFLNL